MELYNVFNAESGKYPVVVSIPHSGTYVPEDIRSAMLPGVLLPNADWFLRELYSFLPDMDVTVIASNVSRYVIDLNRDKVEDLDGEDFWTTLVYSRNTFEKPLYPRPLHHDEIADRIERFYNPYHAAMERLIGDKLKSFGKVLLLDLHSFCVDFIEGADEDISISNYDNQSSTPESIEDLRRHLADQGYKVGVNVILGRYILKHYKKLFGDNINCIQVELRYSQYIGDRYYDEEELSGWDESLFADAQRKLQSAFSRLLNGLEE